mmetsp:Transcript_5222/g.9066  ORF Transcript_5222/g.9066 Transcript_5222/m.9066 type:complete len:126 (-) Transcript_5222:59-436(-)
MLHHSKFKAEQFEGWIVLVSGSGCIFIVCLLSRPNHWTGLHMFILQLQVHVTNCGGCQCQCRCFGSPSSSSFLTSEGDLHTPHPVCPSFALTTFPDKHSGSLLVVNSLQKSCDEQKYVRLSIIIP